MRHLEGLEDTEATPQTSWFIDSSVDTLDEEAQSLLARLKLDKIPLKLGGRVYQKYTVR